MDSLSSEDVTGPPEVPPDSPGSSVSSQFQNEYDELLKYAVVRPTINSQTLPDMLNVTERGSPISGIVQAQLKGLEVDDGSDAEPRTPVNGPTSYPPPYDSTAHSHDTNASENPPVSTTSRNPPVSDASRNPPVSNTSKNPPVSDASRLSHFLDEESFRDNVNTGVSDFTISLEHDVARMENLLDQWTEELKRKVMGEFGEVKLRVTEHHEKNLAQERNKQAAVNYKLQTDIENMKELLHTYEMSMERKNQVISDLSQGVQAQQRKMDMMRMFCEWRIKHGEARREEIIGALAERYRSRVMLQRCWRSWRSVVEGGWKQRVEKACQAKAQEVCTSLKDNYEEQIAMLTASLEQSRAEVAELHAQRDAYEETMKKAFMRGVCALNMEAMSMFGQNSGHTNVTTVAPSDDDHFPTNQQPVFNTEPPGAPPPRVVVANPQSGHIQVTDTAITSQSKGRGKNVGRVKNAHSKTVGRGSQGTVGGTLNPPMSSVVVERHQPVNKQTIGQATAAKYPAVRQSTLGSAVPGPQSGGVQRKIAGQTDSTGTKVKMVE